MPRTKSKRKNQGRKQAERHAKAIARRERKAGSYCKPGDPDFKSLSEQLRVQGLALKDVLGDGYVFWATCLEIVGVGLMVRQPQLIHCFKITNLSMLKMNFVDEHGERGTRGICLHWLCSLG